MAKRSEIFNVEAIEGLFAHHPYLLIFQKEDWKDYLFLIGRLYDFLEEEAARVPFEVLRSLVLRHYAQRGLANTEQKIHHFFHLAIGELQVLRDSHDQFGQRFIETTRAGKELLQMTENLLERRTRYSGTGAETLLGALNDILASRKQMTEEVAIAHHKDKIKAYQDDIRRIRSSGLAHAELLPIPHSNEALFSQADEAAIHILSAIEDVKSAIERQRQDLAQAYFVGARSAGASLSALTEFYERLYSSTEYLSYKQAKSLLSHLEGYSSRFGLRDIDRILSKIRDKELIPRDGLARSSLPGFMSAFQNADHGIQEKIKAQIRLLQQQVHYALNTDVAGLQTSIHGVLALMLEHGKEVEAFFSQNPQSIDIPSDFDMGLIELAEFNLQHEAESVELVSEAIEAEEMRTLFLALVQAEETTLREILGNFRAWFQKAQQPDLALYQFRHGLAEYYVLSEIELFDPSLAKTEVGTMDLEISTKQGTFVLRNVKRYRYTTADSKTAEKEIEVPNGTF